MEQHCHCAERKPAHCPACDSARVVDIVYGYPGPELMEAAANKDVVLGGCCIDDDMPRWQCVECGAQIHAK